MTLRWGDILIVQTIGSGRSTHPDAAHGKQWHDWLVTGNGCRVIIEDGDNLRAVCKIQPLSDGGYSVIAPYHAAKEGWLFKHRVDYREREMTFNMAEMQHFVASDRVKLSHHWDGFVQFSGENPQTIRSGRNPLTGEPKGLAIMSAPIWRPIKDGPTFGLVLWGATNFKQINNTRGTDMVFHSDEMYYRVGTAYNYNAYQVEGWIFGANMWDGVRGTGNNLRLSANFPSSHAPNVNLEFRVIPLPTADTDVFLGVRVCKMRVNFPSPSGFQLGGPSNRRRGHYLADTLKASYPKDPDIVEAESLDYTPD